jgi:LRR receptor-like serine/threonine-protein kinase FLS2
LAAPAAASVPDASVSVHLEALLAFKKAVTADPNSTLSSWTMGAGNGRGGGGFPPHCNWTGLACDGAGHVTSIELAETGLRGTLTPFLGNITTLQLLDLTSNRFGGAIPPQLGRLDELEGLGLGVNNFTGEIPPEPTGVGPQQQHAPRWHPKPPLQLLGDDTVQCLQQRPHRRSP